MPLASTPRRAARLPPSPSSARLPQWDHSLQVRPRPLFQKCPRCIKTDREILGFGICRDVPGCMARPRGTRWTSKIDERESCINLSGLRSGAIAPGHHGYPRASESYYKVHGRPLHRFRDRLSIAIVILMTFEERLHVLRRDQTHIVADRCKLPADVMGARAGLHADQAARNIGKTASKLTTGNLLLQNDGAPRLICPSCPLAHIQERPDGPLRREEDATHHDAVSQTHRSRRRDTVPTNARPRRA